MQRKLGSEEETEYAAHDAVRAAASDVTMPVPDTGAARVGSRSTTTRADGPERGQPRRWRRPLARLAGRSTARRIAASAPIRRTCSLARVTAV